MNKYLLVCLILAYSNTCNSMQRFDPSFDMQLIDKARHNSTCEVHDILEHASTISEWALKQARNHAIDQGNFAIIQLLHSYHAPHDDEVEPRTGYMNTRIDQSIIDGNVDNLCELLSHLPHITQYHLHHLLHLALDYGHITIITYLVEQHSYSEFILWKILEDARANGHKDLEKLVCQKLAALCIN